MRNSIYSLLMSRALFAAAAIAAFAPEFVAADSPSAAPSVTSDEFVSSLKVGMSIRDVHEFVRDRYSIPLIDSECVEMEQVLYERYLFEDASSVVITFESGFRAMENRIASFEVLHFEALNPRIQPARLDLVRAIHVCPRAVGRNLKPIQLIRAVNALRAAGKEEAIKALRAYFALNLDEDGHTMKFFDRFRYGIHDNRAIFVARLLFVRADGKAEMPEFRDGAGSPNVATIGPEWPLFPLVLENDIPFCLVSGYVLFGAPASIMDDLRFYEKQCIVRKTPLAPTKSPIQTVEQILHSDRWRTAERKSQGDADAARHLLQAQAISAIDHLMPSRKLHIETNGGPDGNKAADWLWNSLVHDPQLQNVVWDAQKQMFVAGK